MAEVNQGREDRDVAGGNAGGTATELGDTEEESQRLLLDRLDTLTRFALPEPLEIYQLWAYQVIRYSFQTVLLAAQAASFDAEQWHPGLEKAL